MCDALTVVMTKSTVSGLSVLLTAVSLIFAGCAGSDAFVYTGESPIVDGGGGGNDETPLSEIPQSVGKGGLTGERPEAPILVLGDSGSNYINLRWVAAARADGYRVYRKNSPTASYSLLNNVSGLTYGDGSLPSNASYRYVVRAYNATGDSADSNELSAGTSICVNTRDPIFSIHTNIPPSSKFRSWNKIGDQVTFTRTQSFTWGFDVSDDECDKAFSGTVSLCSETNSSNCYVFKTFNSSQWSYVTGWDSQSIPTTLDPGVYTLKLDAKMATSGTEFQASFPGFLTIKPLPTPNDGAPVKVSVTSPASGYYCAGEDVPVEYEFTDDTIGTGKLGDDWLLVTASATSVTSNPVYGRKSTASSKLYFKATTAGAYDVTVAAYDYDLRNTSVNVGSINILADNLTPANLTITTPPTSNLQFFKYLPAVSATATDDCHHLEYQFDIVDSLNTSPNVLRVLTPFSAANSIASGWSLPTDLAATSGYFRVQVRDAAGHVAALTNSKKYIFARTPFVELSVNPSAGPYNAGDRIALTIRVTDTDMTGMMLTSLTEKMGITGQPNTLLGPVPYSVQVVYPNFPLTFSGASYIFSVIVTDNTGLTGTRSITINTEGVSRGLKSDAPVVFLDLGGGGAFNREARFDLNDTRGLQWVQWLNAVDGFFVKDSGDGSITSLAEFASYGLLKSCAVDAVLTPAEATFCGIKLWVGSNAPSPASTGTLMDLDRSVSVP
jgi:hypothetical protein